MATGRKKPTKAEIIEETAAGEAESNDAVQSDAIVDDDVLTDAAGTHSSDEAAAPQNAEPESAAPVRQRGGLFMLVSGGVIAGIGGFLVAQYLDNESWPFSRGPSAAETLAVEVAAQDARIEELTRSLDELNAKLTDMPSRAITDGLIASTDDLAAELMADAKALASVDQRLVDVENRPIPVEGAADDAVAVYETQLAAMRSMFQKELERVEAAQQAATESQSGAEKIALDSKIGAAVADIRASVSSGAAFDEPLAVLTGNGVEVSQSLQEIGRVGVVTLAELRAEFPDSARLALTASVPTDATGGTTDKIAAFFRTQLGARSLEPREGTDPDAILSRAEAALSEGDLRAVFAELDGLPAEGVSMMQPWRARAQDRVTAETLVTELLRAVEN